LRDKLARERAAKPRDPKTYTAIELNPAYRDEMKALLDKVAPGGTYDATKASEYVEKFKAVVVTDPKATFTVMAEMSGKRITLSGEVSDRKYHDRLIDLFVAMKLFDLSNEIKLPQPAKKLP
jgi:hypothetical protein